MFSGIWTSSLCTFQDAKKGVLFADFPPVLQLQLKRFEYDFMRDTMIKVGTVAMACLFSVGGIDFILIPH